jgi:hypothetical protein
MIEYTVILAVTNYINKRLGPLKIHKFLFAGKAESEEENVS